MIHPEVPTVTDFAIAGQTSTGKTRLGEQVVQELREKNYTALLFSVGDLFRLLTMHTALQGDPVQMENAVKETLSHTHIDVAPSGRILLHYNGESFKQTYQNGNSAARLTQDGVVMFAVNTFIANHILHDSHVDFVGLDGRERRNASVLVRTFGTDAARVGIRKMDLPDACRSLPDEEILRDIQSRDAHEKPFIDALLNDEVNVLHVERSVASPDMDRLLATRVAGTLVDFKEGKLAPNFGTVSLHV